MKWFKGIMYRKNGSKGLCTERMVQRDYVQKEWFKGIMYRNNGSIGVCIERMIQRDYVQK